MTRRGFFRLALGGAALAATRTFPFRVYSFPSDIRIADANCLKQADLEYVVNHYLTSQSAWFLPKTIVVTPELALIAKELLNGPQLHVS